MPKHQIRAPTLLPAERGGACIAARIHEPVAAAARPQVHAELTLEVPVEHGLLLENLLDLAHAPFTHTSTFAKGWPVPEVVKFNARRMLGGHWEPYPIDMAFEPPCMVLSTIGARMKFPRCMASLSWLPLAGLVHIWLSPSKLLC
jgi:phenylpropionate dioxygenase-like ring-hydroxylating dioxygenase large terminal subunit